MSSVSAAPPRRRAEITVTAAEPHPNGWWGMLLLIATEATLFAVLIATYFYLRFKTPGWPPDGISDPKILKPLVYLGILLLTSVPMQVAFVAARAGRRGLVVANLAAAVLIGGLYLWLQADLLRKNAGSFTPRTDAYGSIYYTLTVGHAAHVFAGLLLNLWLMVHVARRITVYRENGVHAAALYWHAVNALAVAVTLTVLSPSL
jgi:heme/copper-type cytochrome/quinol oxidase subunit 3